MLDKAAKMPYMLEFLQDCLERALPKEQLYIPGQLVRLRKPYGPYPIGSVLTIRYSYMQVSGEQWTHPRYSNEYMCNGIFGNVSWVNADMLEAADATTY